jgi:peptidoglycan/LPS O-acetylase OafA/YrhL
MDPQHSDDSSVWRTLAGLGALGFGAMVALFLITEHRAHLYGALPFLLVLACPIMMLHASLARLSQSSRPRVR